MMKRLTYAAIFASVPAMPAFSFPTLVDAQPLGDCWECVESTFSLGSGNTVCMGGSYMGLSDCMQIGDQDHHHCASYGDFCLLRWDDSHAVSPPPLGEEPPATLGYLALQGETWIIRRCGNATAGGLATWMKAGE